KAVEAFRTTETSSTCYKTGATLKLFGVLPLKTVQVKFYSKDMLIPGGIPFGVKLYTRGVVVVGISQVQGVSRGRSPAGEAGIEKGDVILSIDEQDVNTVQDVSKIIEDSNGQPVTVILQRGNQKKEVTLNPEKCSVEKRYKCGMWIRDSTAGIGTVTFIKPDTMEFGGLGHGICDSDTGTLMPLMRGNVVSVSILDIVKGSEGAPGELKGSFDSVQIGSLLANTSRGVFGTLTELPKGTKMNALPIGLKDEVQVGEATIYTTINGKGVRAYTAKIEKIIDKDVETKNFIIRVTD
ncbi:MAG TPA: SpoIVB peptidase, partial [Clostridiales bacterium]|nr:SpoIVB peptidase [Clostridiales bacterium]